ncbi:MAG: response regulator [Verrucomicrobiota bacterium]
MSGRILVLDDEENYAKMLRDLLLENNYHVDMATRPEKAIMQLEEVRYDLVIADYKMPVMDGAAFLQRSRELYPNLPFILVSGLMNTPELVKVANMSVTLVLEKPLDTHQFLETVARFSTPISDDERATAVSEPESGEARSTSKTDLSGKTQYFCGTSRAAKAFLHQAWTILSKGSFLYIGSPKGSDLDLALKDFSIWLGNEDKPVKEYTLPALIELGMAGLQEIDYSDLSRLILVRLSNATQIQEAQAFVQNSDAVERIKVVFQVEGSYFRSAKSKSLDGLIAHLPPFHHRMVDVANYAYRIIVETAESASKPKCADLSSEVMLSILEYGWPGNYQELESSIHSAIHGGANAELTTKSFGDTLSGSSTSSVIPNDRLSFLLQRYQAQILIDLAAEIEGGYDTIQEELSIGVNADELATLPLIKPDIGKL